VATQIIALANDPEVDLNEIAKVLAMDPAIATKILRIANSSMYARQRKTETLRQAVLVLGLDGTLSLALSFSLLTAWNTDSKSSGLDYGLFWRRALLSATASQALAKRLGIKDAEGLFLACLIQNIGVMALDRARPELYVNLGSSQASEQTWIDREREQLGADHAELGGWLLETWRFPERLQQAVAFSHSPETIPEDATEASFVRCVALCSQIAELYLNDTGERRFGPLAGAAERFFGIDKSTLNDLLNEISQLIPDAESIFQTELMNQSNAEGLLDEAKEALLVRSLRALTAVNTLRDQTDSLEIRTRTLEESSRRDPLTGLYNRAFLDEFLDEAFRNANADTAPLSVAFADLDRFKSINDTYGHATGDHVLVTTANILRANVRESDIVARYGGEEFIIVFPNTDHSLVGIITERIVKAFQKTSYDVGVTKDLAVTISVGMATHGDGRDFDKAWSLVKAADEALYAAKLGGRNRCIPYDQVVGQN
jgi:diguanylate cyclase (GGDEF)-like protein